MEQNSSKNISIVYMAAGISSRFGGKIKQFAQVGKNGETLVEVSMLDAIGAGFKEIIFIVGEKTEIPFKEKFRASYNGVPVKYTKQSFDPSKRDRPWGTIDAVVSAKSLINGPFVLCNGDDLYGENSFGLLLEFLQNNADENGCASVGYELGKVIPKKGKINRGIFSVDSKGFVKNIEEHFNIEKSSLAEYGLNEKTPVSMNLFGLTAKILVLLEEKLEQFKKTHLGDRKAECLLPTELGSLIKEGKIKMKLLPTQDKCLGITNPEDEENLRQELAGI